MLNKMKPMRRFPMMMNSLKNRPIMDQEEKGTRSLRTPLRLMRLKLVSL
jgi:hypothetical protein